MSATVSESEVSKCRWYEEFVEDLSDWELLFDGSVNDYQGDVYIVAKEPDNDRYVIIDYSYGSCEICDEFYNMSEEQLAEEKENIRTYFTKNELIEYVKRWIIINRLSSLAGDDENKKYEFFKQFLHSVQESEVRPK